MNAKQTRMALAIGLGLALALAWQSVSLLAAPFLGAPKAPVPTKAEVPAPTGVEGTTRYVAPDGDDNNACSSIVDRCRTIQRGVDVAETGDLVLVATGTYTGVRNVPSLNTNALTATQVVVTPQLWTTARS